MPNTFASDNNDMMKKRILGTPKDMYGKLRMERTDLDSSTDEDSCGGVQVKTGTWIEPSSDEEIVVFRGAKVREMKSMPAIAARFVPASSRYNEKDSATQTEPSRSTAAQSPNSTDTPPSYPDITLISQPSPFPSIKGKTEDEKPRSQPKNRSEDTTTQPPIVIRRPVSEPPQFNYIAFVRRVIPSDRRFKVLFPDDIEKRTRAKDLLIEHELLDWYHAWTRLEILQMRNDVRLRAARFDNEPIYKGPSDEERTEFLAGLKRELAFDNGTVNEELQEVYRLSTDGLAKWEFKYLDNDGDTKRIQNLMDDRSDRNHDIFRGCKEARVKYGYLCTRTLREWETKFLHKADEGTSIIRERLKAGDDVFIGCQEARRKYQHVLNPTLEQWEGYNLDENGSTTLIRERLLKGRDVFDGCQDAKDKYGHLIPTELEKWEHIFLDHERSFKSYAPSCGFSLDNHMFRNCKEAKAVYGWITAPSLEEWEKLFLDDDGGTTWIQEQLLDEKRVFYACDEAADKYAHLTPTRLESWEYKNLFRFSGVTTGLENYMKQNENVFEFCEKARAKYQHLALPAYKWLRDVNQSRLDKEEAEERGILGRREEYAVETGVMVTPLLDISAQPNDLGSDFDTSSDESASESSSTDSGDSYHTVRGPSRGEVSGSCCSHGAGDDASIKCIIF